MNILNNIKKQLEKLPEFSNSKYIIVGYVVAAIITITGVFFVYEILTSDALTISAQWNMFKSPLGSLCIFAGFVWAMLWWGKFTHWSSTPVIETRDRYSGKLLKREENYDVMEQGFAKIIMPLLGHFLIEPIMYGAIIYYPIQCVIALVGTVFPYILSLIVLSIIVGSWTFTKLVQIRYRSVLLVLCGVAFSLAFCLGGYAIMKSSPNSTIQMFADSLQSSEENTDGIDDQFEGFGEEGLFGSLPIGTTVFIGEMNGVPIELRITKNDDSGDLKALYRDVKYSRTMDLSGESLPSMGGNISFYGRVEGEEWIFNLSGTAEAIHGNVQCGDKNFEIHLKQK